MNTRLNMCATTMYNDSEISELAAKCGLSFVVTKILVSRGMDSAEKIKQFLEPDLKDLLNPFDLSGMQETVERIKVAVEGKEKVVVYGDYDADGICSTAILTKFFLELGLDVLPYIPSRLNEGYGVNSSAIERIIEDYLPDLIVTCDCGISAKNEVQMILDAGVDVIVTDHHEVPNEIPECLCINPKISNQKYKFTSLCGAGVALKIVHAFHGLEMVKKYLDLACLATIADLVPLVSENRIIVAYGIKMLGTESGNLGLNWLIKSLDFKNQLSSGDIAYKLAPRINAAGRMGDAYRALNLLLSNDKKEISKIIADLDNDNIKRKEICKDLYEDAVLQISQSYLIDSKAIILSNKIWEKGLTSIVAAQIASAYNKPTMLMVKSGDNYKGTARSIEGVNIYNVLQYCSDLLVEFGGHEQAAGFTILEKNIDSFKVKANKYLDEKYEEYLFFPSANYDMKLQHFQINLELASELEQLEPFGNGNLRPVFCLPKQQVDCSYMKLKPTHLVLKCQEKIIINAFGFGESYNIFSTETEFDLCVELTANFFNSKKYLSTVLKAFDFQDLGEPKLALTTKLNFLNTLSAVSNSSHIEKVEDFENALQKAKVNNSGVLVVAYRLQSYKNFMLDKENKKFIQCFKNRNRQCNFNTIVLSPLNDFDCRGFDKIFFLDLPVFDCKHNLNSSIITKCFAPIVKQDFIHDYDISRENLIQCYKILEQATKNQINIQKSDVVEYMTLLDYSSKEKEILMIAYTIFSELGLIIWNSADGRIAIDKNIKNDLANSKILQFLHEKRKTL